MVSERVLGALRENMAPIRAAVRADLEDVFRTAESLGLLVCTAQGRLSVEDLTIRSPIDSVEVAMAVADSMRSAPSRAPGRTGRGRRVKAQTPASATKARLALPAPAGEHGACDVCGEALKRMENRKETLCRKHAGRWYQATHWAEKSGNPKPDYQAWVERQKAGGGRAKKA